MQTDLHRVIRTQHLTDDHCQVCTLFTCVFLQLFMYALFSTSSIKLSVLSNLFTAQTLSIEISNQPIFCSTPTVILRSAISALLEA
jgi:hypothetical protein